MQGKLEISLAPERLDEGTVAERACFGLLSVRFGEAFLTEGFDSHTRNYRTGPLVSGYHLAEWLVWNWWRLCSEPRSRADGWWRAHQMNSIGEGYVWPNITIFSDGVRTTLLSDKSARPDARPFRYFGARPAIAPTASFEAAVDNFVPQMLARLRDAGIADASNLDRLWADLIGERGDPAQRRFRRLEALLGRDPDELDEAAIASLVARTEYFGADAVEELAADSAQDAMDDRLSGVDEFFGAVSDRPGTQAVPGDAIRLAPGTRIPRGADLPAWRLGTAYATAIREQAGLGDLPVVNERLARMAGTSANILDGSAAAARISYLLDERPNSARIVLRSRWETSRRFDLARLIGDRLLWGAGEPLHPATRAGTYRQKAQRAFAVELLAPFDAVDDMMQSDYSPERQHEVAEHFDVSPMAVNRALKNHRRIESGTFDEDYEVAAA